MLFLVLSSFFILSNAIQLSKFNEPVAKMIVQNASSPDLMSIVLANKGSPKNLLKILENADPAKVQEILVLVRALLQESVDDLSRLTTASTDANSAYDSAVATYDAAVVAQTASTAALAQTVADTLAAKQVALGAKTAAQDGLDAERARLEGEIASLEQVITILEGLIGTTGVFDFESGTLDGWTLTGTAFNTQPTFGDNPTARSRGQPSQHQGNWWIGGYEDCHTESGCPNGATQGDGPVGTALSPSFTLTGTSANFLIGGGNYNGINAELIVGGAAVRTSHGDNHESMTRKTWDISAWTGQQAQLKLVDSSSGGWGHLNFDDWQQA